MFDVMILAAGQGGRMRPLTDTLPKPLLAVGASRLIEHHLYKLVELDVRNVIINISYLADSIEKNIGNGEKYGLSIRYSHEPDGPYGTAAGIRHALPLIASDSFMIINSDVYTDYDFSSLAIESGVDGNVILVPNPDHNRAGDFAYVDGFLADKPVSTNPKMYPKTFAGIGMYRKHLFENPKFTRTQLGAMLRAVLQQKNRIAAQCFCGLWIDVGTPERLELARQAAVTKPRILTQDKAPPA